MRNKVSLTQLYVYAHRRRKRHNAPRSPVVKNLINLAKVDLQHFAKNYRNRSIERKNIIERSRLAEKVASLVR